MTQQVTLTPLNNIWCLFILDKSGSMYSHRESTIAAFNSIVDEQLKYNDMFVKLVLFDSVVQPISNITKLTEDFKLNEKKYRIDGMTALYKAIVDGIESVKKDLKTTTTENYPKDVFVFIFSDGEENHSGREYTLSKVREQIEFTEKEYGWKYQFFGMDLGYKSGVDLVGVQNTVDTKSMQDYSRGVSVTLAKSRKKDK